MIWIYLYIYKKKLKMINSKYIQLIEKMDKNSLLNIIKEIIVLVYNWEINVFE